MEKCANRKTKGQCIGALSTGYACNCNAKGSTICPTSEIVCLPVLIFTYSHVENALFFALDLVVFCKSNYFFKHTNWYTITSTTFSNIPIGIL